jgi:excisionase family DNA binding protein
MNVKPTDLLTADQAAEILRVTPSTIRALCSKGQIKATKHGWQWLIVRGDLKGVKSRRPGRQRKGGK